MTYIQTQQDKDWDNILKYVNFVSNNTAFGLLCMQLNCISGQKWADEGFKTVQQLGIVQTNSDKVGEVIDLKNLKVIDYNQKHRINCSIWDAINKQKEFEIQIDLKAYSYVIKAQKLGLYMDVTLYKIVGKTAYIYSSAGSSKFIFTEEKLAIK